jgi:hypothetical protein
MGLEVGDVTDLRPCSRTGKAEYFGPLLNHAARIAQNAYGGQVSEGCRVLLGCTVVD